MNKPRQVRGSLSSWLLWSSAGSSARAPGICMRCLQGQRAYSRNTLWPLGCNLREIAVINKSSRAYAQLAVPNPPSFKKPRFDLPFTSNPDLRDLHQAIMARDLPESIKIIRKIQQTPTGTESVPDVTIMAMLNLLILGKPSKEIPDIRRMIPSWTNTFVEWVHRIYLRSLKSHHHPPSPELCCLLIQGLGRYTGKTIDPMQKLLEIFEVMQNSNYIPKIDMFTAIAIIRIADRGDQAEQLIQVLEDQGYAEPQLLYEQRVRRACNVRNIQLAADYIRIAEDKGIITRGNIYDILARALSKEGHVDLADRLLSHMVKRGFSYNEYTTDTQLTAYAEFQPGKAELLSKTRMEAGIPRNTYHYRALLKAATNREDWEAVEKHYRSARVEGEVSPHFYGHAIRAFSLAGMPEKVEACLSDMQRDGLVLESHLYLEIVAAYCRLAQFDKATEWVEAALKNDLRFDDGPCILEPIIDGHMEGFIPTEEAITKVAAAMEIVNFMERFPTLFGHDDSAFLPFIRAAARVNSESLILEWYQKIIHHGLRRTEKTFRLLKFFYATRGDIKSVDYWEAELVKAGCSTDVQQREIYRIIAYAQNRRWDMVLEAWAKIRVTGITFRERNVKYILNAAIRNREYEWLEAQLDSLGADGLELTERTVDLVIKKLLREEQLDFAERFYLQHLDQGHRYPSRMLGDDIVTAWERANKLQRARALKKKIRETKQYKDSNSEKR
ncbi:hypothetical protein DFS34DRAFT_688133 [Phlyctochytrium arcticum]|nr:hypothetical protein DFS34DRAFT_688133 [Phlyctochytrium arcticum]